MKTTTFALTFLLSQYTTVVVDGQLANAQRRVSPTDRFTNPSHTKQQRRTLRTTSARTLQEDGSMSLATDVTSMSIMAAAQPEVKDMFETTEDEVEDEDVSIEAVEPAVAGGVDPARSGDGPLAKAEKSTASAKATKLFKDGVAKSSKAKVFKTKSAKAKSVKSVGEKTVDAKAEKEESGSKAGKAKGEKMSMPSAVDAKAGKEDSAKGASEKSASPKGGR